MPAKLSNKDLRRVLEAIELLHSCDDPIEFPSTMRSAAELLVRGDIIAYSEVDLRNQAPNAEAEPDLDEIASLLEVIPMVTTDDPCTERDINGVVPWMVRFAEEHPLFRLALTEADPPVAKISDFLSLPKFRGLGLYRQFFQPLDVTRQIAVCPTRCEGLVTGLTVNRSGRDFSERDRACLSLLTPHLRNAYREIWLRANIEKQLAEQNRMLENLPTAVVGLTADGRRIEFATRLGWKMLRARFPKFNGRHLPEPLMAWVRDVLNRLGSMTDPSAVDTSMKFPTEDGILWVKFVKSSERIHLIFRRNEQETTVRRLTRFGLTKREAEVLYRLTRGETDKQIAKALGIRPATARTHVERIRGKLHVETRTAAATIAQEWLRARD